ncbi:MAG: archaeosortase/exosortase family protein [Halobacteriota archaeon]
MDRSQLRQNQSARLKVGLLFACLALTFLVFWSAFANIAPLLNYAALKQNGFYIWAVLGLCVVWGYMKRKEILDAARTGTDSRWVLAGTILAGASLGLLYYSATFVEALPLTLFAMAFVVVAQFTLFFGKASKIPLMLLGVFGIAVVFPALLESAVAAPFPRATAVLCVSTLQLARVPVTLNGVTVTLNSLMGYNITVNVDTRCAGSDSLAIFLAIFALMLIDRRPGNKAVLGLFIFGVVGAYLQNFVRLLALFTAGYYYGANALWAVHDYASYILFPVWFLGFAVVYLKYARKPGNPAIGRMKSTEGTPEL